VVRDLVVLVLGRLSYRIDTVVNARDALRHVGQEPVSLILLSSTLPDLAGPALIGKLRELPGGAAVPVVAICPVGEEDVRQACLEAGAAECLSRPLEIERLLRLIERLLRGGAEGPTEEAALDFDHLGGFTDGDLQLEDELVTLYLSTADVYLQRMRDALGNAETWTAVAHALKGASGNLGARRVQSLALAAEHSAPSPAQLEVIERAIDEVRESFAARRAG
jgi:two-component system sensor histidine kinase/response regulator